jgi:membrane associated rhomboid family serine protease
MFAHASWLHIIGNMLFLWIFGNNVEDAMGRARFLVFYLLAGLAATALQATVTLTMGNPVEAQIPNVGASGAIAGVLGAYFLLYAAARVIALVPLFLFLLPVELPAVLLIGVWFLFQLWQGGFSLISPGAAGGVAFFAHIGGFAFGLFDGRPVRPAPATVYRRSLVARRAPSRRPVTRHARVPRLCPGSRKPF